MDIHNEGFGFTKVFTSDFPDTSGSYDQPNKKPYVIFVLPESDADHGLNYLRQNKLSRLATIDVKTNELIVTVTSDRKVKEAIDIFIKEESTYYPFDSNKEVYSHLDAYRTACIQRQEKKPPKQTPSISNLDSELSEVVTTNDELPESVNETRRVTRKGKDYIFKVNTSGRSISELETFNGYCYRLLLGDRHPKITNVHDEQGVRKGVVSRLFDPYVSIYERADQLGDDYVKPSKDELLKGEVVKVLVASYVEEENDLHGGNYGMGPNGYYVKIDDDQSTWPLTSKYAEMDPQKSQPSLGVPVEPINSFPVTSQDIMSFPNLMDASPKNWPGKDRALISFHEVKKEDKFTDDKYYMFLKRILIPDTAYADIGKVISSDKKRKEFVDHKCKKTEDLKKVLLNMPEFQNYIIKNPDVIKDILSEFKEYNDDFKKDKSSNADFFVDLDKVKSNFHDIDEKIRFIKTQNNKSKLSQNTNSMFSINNTNQKTRNDIDKILIFMNENIEFLAAPFKNQKEFSDWASSNENALELSGDLTKALNEDIQQILQLNDAILGESNKNNGLINGDEKLARDLLEKNTKLRSAFIKHMDNKNPAIDGWYKDNNIPKKRPSM